MCLKIHARGLHKQVTDDVNDLKASGVNVL